jgi:hypothetical protein
LFAAVSSNFVGSFDDGNKSRIISNRDQKKGQMPSRIMLRLTAIFPGAPRIGAGTLWCRDLARSDMEMSCSLSCFVASLHKTRAAPLPGSRRKDGFAESVGLFCPRRRRSWTVTRLRRRASRSAFFTCCGMCQHGQRWRLCVGRRGGAPVTFTGFCRRKS